MNMLQRAIEIAMTAHSGQFDKGGEPYILHPLCIMFQMQTEEEKIVAVLHDVVEDSTFTIEDLKCEGFSDQIVDAVDHITKRNNENYVAYIYRVKQNEIARKVKIKDLNHNMDVLRLSRKITINDSERIIKYATAIGELL